MSDQTEPNVRFSILEDRKDSRVSIQIGTDVLQSMRTECLKTLNLSWRDIEQTVRPEEIRKLIVSTLTHHRNSYPRGSQELEFVIRWVEDGFTVDESEPWQRNRYNIGDVGSRFSVGDRVRGVHGSRSKGTVVNVPGGKDDPVEIEWDTTRTINMVRPESIELLPTVGGVVSGTPIEIIGDPNTFIEGLTKANDAVAKAVSVPGPSIVQTPPETIPAGTRIRRKSDGVSGTVKHKWTEGAPWTVEVRWDNSSTNTFYNRSEFDVIRVPEDTGLYVNLKKGDTVRDVVSNRKGTVLEPWKQGDNFSSIRVLFDGDSSPTLVVRAFLTWVP